MFMFHSSLIGFEVYMVTQKSIYQIKCIISNNIFEQTKNTAFQSHIQFLNYYTYFYAKDIPI